MPRKRNHPPRPASILGDRTVPVLLGTRSLQQLVAALSRYTTLRLADASDAVGVVDLNISSDLLKSGSIMLSEPGRERYVAINERLPQLALLTQCLELLEPLGSWKPRFEAAPRPFSAKEPVCWEDALFGHHIRLNALLAVEGFGGNVAASQIDSALALSPGRGRAILNRLADRGVLTLQSSGDVNRYFFPDAPWASALRAYLSRLIAERPELQAAIRRTEPRAKYIPAGRVGRARYKNVEIRTMQKPVGMCVPASLAPLLFSTDARRRILEAIALCGSASCSEISVLAKVSADAPLRRLHELGIIEKQQVERCAVYRIARNLPGRQHLIQLLVAMARRYSPELRRLDPPLALSASGEWAGNPEAIFGYESRGVALIGARCVGGVDASTLRKLSPGVERVQLRRALHLFEALGVIATRNEGNAILYELNEHWFGFRPLAAFLDALVDSSPRHQQWRRVVPFLQAPRRRKMAENAARTLLRRHAD